MRACPISYDNSLIPIGTCYKHLPNPIGFTNTQSNLAIISVDLSLIVVIQVVSSQVPYFDHLLQPATKLINTTDSTVQQHLEACTCIPAISKGLAGIIAFLLGWLSMR